MQSGFDAALALVFRNEGGFSNNPFDPGGATKYGITRAALARARERPVSLAEVMALTRDEAARIYRTFYWNAVAGDELPTGLDLCVFDYAVNSGPLRAARTLQKALGVPQDAIIGPVTLAAARADPVAAIEKLTSLRLGFLGRLPAFAMFGRGWKRRVADTRRAALERAGIILPSSSQEPAMNDTKSIFASRTVWANVVGLLCVGLSAIGFNTSGIDTSGISDAIIQLVTAGSLLASTVFRVIASKKIAGKTGP